jgi:hypothetical protein
MQPSSQGPCTCPDNAVDLDCPRHEYHRDDHRDIVDRIFHERERREAFETGRCVVS